MSIPSDPLGSSSSTHPSPWSSATSLNIFPYVAPPPQPTRTANPASRTGSAHRLQSQVFSSTANASSFTTGAAAPIAPYMRINDIGDRTTEDKQGIEQYGRISTLPVPILPHRSRSSSSLKPLDNSNNNNQQHTLLEDDTYLKPLLRSQSTYTFVCPNQLQGVVVESMRSPKSVNTRRQPFIPNRNGSSNEKNNNNNPYNPHGSTLEPNSPEQKGIPWMLYCHRSQSTSAIYPPPPTLGSNNGISHGASAGSMVMAGAGAAVNMIASVIGSHARSGAGSREQFQYSHQQQQLKQQSTSVLLNESTFGSAFGIDRLYNQSFTPSVMNAIGVDMDNSGTDTHSAMMRKSTELRLGHTIVRPRSFSLSMSKPILLPSTPESTASFGYTVPPATSAGGTWSDEDCSSSFSSDTDVEGEGGADNTAGSLHVHRPARRTNSSRTGGKSHFSAYRPQMNLENSTSSALKDGIGNSTIEKCSTQETNGQIFNRHLQYAQKTGNGSDNTGKQTVGSALDACSPSINPTTAFSPTSITAASIHSALTTVSGSSCTSDSSGSSGITGTTYSSIYSISSSDTPEIYITRTTVSDSSTLCENTTKPESSSRRNSFRPRGIRRFIRWTCPNHRVEPSFSPSLPSSTLQPSEKPTKPNNSTETSQRRLTLQELSARDTRFYSKDQPNPTFTTAPRGPLGCRGKKGPKRPDAKAFFSNERTYLHWIKFGLLLGSMALTLLSFGKALGLHVGLFLVFVAMLTLGYATATFHLRDRWMKQFRLDVLYYDRVGPTVLFLALFLAFATNVTLTVLKLMKEDGNDDGLNFYNSHYEGPMDI
ncbi:vacuolar transporter chaperone [Linnemannia zychae]|nr:vacuolar transporter chaperone [Linnemannia zychae]